MRPELQLIGAPVVVPGTNDSNAATDWVERKPLQRELPPADPYPVDALGESLSGAVLDIARSVKAPVAMGGNSILAAATLAAQAHADVEIDGRVMNLAGFFLTSAESGERKSAVDRHALRPHFERQETLHKEYTSELSEYTRKSRRTREQGTMR